MLPSAWRAIREKENKMSRIRRIAPVVLVGLMLPLCALSADNPAGEVKGIEVVSNLDKVRIEVETEGTVECKAYMMTEPDRLVVDCFGARNMVKGRNDIENNSLVYRVRTSQYQYEPEMITRIVLDLKGNVDYKNWTEGDIEVVELTRSGVTSAAAEDEMDESPADPVRVESMGASMGPVLPLIVPNENVVSGSAGDAVGKSSKPASWKPRDEKEAAKSAPEKAPEAVKTESGKKAVKKAESPWIDQAASKKSTPAGLKTTEVPAPSGTAYNSGAAYRVDRTMESNFAESYMRGSPAGGGGFGMGSRRITIDAQGADIKTVLRTISDFAGVNIVAGSDVKGDVYVHIKDVPWEEALAIFLKAHGYGYRKEYGMIRVAEMTRLMKEELDEKTAERKKDDLRPLMTRIIFVHNSSAEEIQTALANVVSARGRIDVDLGSNALIVNDIEKNIDKIEEIVRDLDIKNYQVDINAKLVEIDVEASREMGINWGVLNLHKSGFSGMGSAEVDADIPLSSGTIKFGTVRSWGELSTILQMLEKDNKANIISNPRITTMGNREASILVGKEIPLIVADEAGNPITELTKIGIMLRVIPHVNSDRTITLDLHPEVSELQSESTAQGGVIISTAEADTRVIVNNGETAVIGGLIKQVDTELKTGVPVLKDIPYFGALFSSSSNTSKKQELVIFVTPTIVE